MRVRRSKYSLLLIDCCQVNMSLTEGGMAESDILLSCFCSFVVVAVCTTEAEI